MSHYNPFDTPIVTNDLTAEDAVDLFSDVFSEFHTLKNIGHTFLNGARGSGKTMMYRLMQPDCMLLKNKCSVKELDFIGIYFGVKSANFNRTEFVYLHNHADSLISEHYLTTNLTTIIFDQLATLPLEESPEDLEKMKAIYKTNFVNRLTELGWKFKIPVNESHLNLKNIFSAISLECLELLKVFNAFADNLFAKAKNNDITYSGILLKYSDFLFKILEQIKSLHCMPSGKPFFIMIDDADNLNQTQKQIINTWISNRSINIISFKISTQLNYKYYRTLYGDRIETPHDYSEINIADRYTSANRSFYKDRIKDVVDKRLKKSGLTNTDPYVFFPVDEKQEKEIKDIFDKYYNEKIAEGKDKKQAYDYAYRYSRPDYIKNLSGNRGSYSYAGFDQLVHISSGNMRQFIQPARDMFDTMITEQLTHSEKSPIQEITHKIQNSVIREYSYKSFVTFFDKLKEEKWEEKKSVENDPKTDEKYKESKTDEIKAAIFDLEKLSNLINSLGKLFNRILLSESSERRVFSFALNDEPDMELKSILDLGVELGFLQEYSIGNKYGTGKSRLYILNRIIAPNFGLDPSSFAGYKFVNCSVLKIAINSSVNFDQYLRKTGLENTFDKETPTLFSQND